MSGIVIYEYRQYAIIAYMRSSFDGPPTNPGSLLREARLRHGLSQAGLAARAGTTQSAISRIESSAVSPAVDTLERLLSLMGERLELSATPADSGVDRTLLADNLSLSSAERVRRGLAFADLVRRNRGAAVGG